jgi:hypothetical protein
MTKHFLFSCIFFQTILLFFSCGTAEKNAEVPPGTVSEEVFTRVLKDFALAESATNMNIKNVNIHKIDSAYAFNVLKENKITKPQFDSALAFYVSHPDLYKKVYENVLVALSEMAAERNPTKKDSILK